LAKVDMKEEQIAYVVYEVVEALVFIHHNNSMHRDLKCENILVNTNADVKLGAFPLLDSFWLGVF